MKHKIISRQEALEQNLKYFYTGIPCKNGHIEQRHVFNYVCSGCRNNAIRKHRKILKDKTKGAFKIETEIKHNEDYEIDSHFDH